MATRSPFSAQYKIIGGASGAFLVLLIATGLLVRFGPRDAAISQRWANVATVEGNIVTSLLSVVNLALVAYVAFVFQRSQKHDDKAAARTSLLAAMLKEWHTGRMYKARRIAENFVNDHPTEPIADLEKTVGDRMVDVWTVTGFFERLSVLVCDLQLLDEDDAAMAFGQIFVFWDDLLLRRLDLAWKSHDRANSLRACFTKQPDYREWQRTVALYRQTHGLPPL